MTSIGLLRESLLLAPKKLVGGGSIKLLVLSALSRSRPKESPLFAELPMRGGALLLSFP